MRQRWQNGVVAPVCLEMKVSSSAPTVPPAQCPLELPTFGSPEAREWTQQWLLEEALEEGLGLELGTKRPHEHAQAKERKMFWFRLRK